MAEMMSNILIKARKDTRTAAQWLNLLHFRVNARAPFFSTSMTLYHDMLDPDATDYARAEACRKMLEPVERQLLFEDQKGIDSCALTRPIDPYRAHWRTTERGAALAAIAWLLRAALEAFDGATPPVDR